MLTILILIIYIIISLISKANQKLINVEDIKTDSKFQNVTYDKAEDIWDDSVLGILTIQKIGLNATVKEGSNSAVLKDYIGHIEETAIYDGNIGLARS